MSFKNKWKIWIKDREDCSIEELKFKKKWSKNIGLSNGIITYALIGLSLLLFYSGLYLISAIAIGFGLINLLMFITEIFECRNLQLFIYLKKEEK